MWAGPFQAGGPKINSFEGSTAQEFLKNQFVIFDAGEIFICG